MHLSVNWGRVAESSENQNAGEIWKEIGGQYFLRTCPMYGYLLVNTTIETQSCCECSGGSHADDFLYGCKDLESGWRSGSALYRLS